MINLFYSAGAMNFDGNGYFWHKLYKFPKLEFVTKTVTLKSKIGKPFLIFKYKNNIWNKISLSNPGIKKWIKRYYNKQDNMILSIAGSDNEIKQIIEILEEKNILLKGIELNFSCPNIKNKKNKIIPKTKYDLYLKLNYKQNPYDYDLDNIKSIRLNSIPMYKGGVSGKISQFYNWPYIEKYNKQGLNISGCSVLEQNDIKRLEMIGCKDVGIGSLILLNSKMVEKLI